MTKAEEATVLARSLEAMGLDELRAAWRARYGAPPSLRSADLLRRMLAWRVQAEAMGGLDRKRVRQILGIGAAKKGRRCSHVSRGVKLAREWQGRVHEVEVSEAGYLYQDKTYASLSAIARQITGVRWNGPRFFGLREEVA